MKDLFMDLRNEKVEKMQEKLKEISTCACNRARFYELAGISQEDYIALEKGERKMTFSEYIAVATVIDRLNNPYMKQRVNDILERGDDIQLGLIEEFYSLFEKFETNIDSDSYYLEEMAKNCTIILTEDSLAYAKKDDTFRELLKEVKECGNKIIIPENAFKALKKKAVSNDARVRSDANIAISLMNRMLKNDVLDINECDTAESEKEEIIAILERENRGQPFVLIMQNIRMSEQIKNTFFESNGVEIKTLTFSNTKKVQIPEYCLEIEEEQVEGEEEKKNEEEEVNDCDVDIFESYDACTSWED